MERRPGLGGRPGSRAARLLEGEGVGIDVRAGGEIALTRLVDLDDHELDAVALGGGRHVLLEAPLTPDAGDFDHLILAVVSRRPVLLAHPERCPAFLREPERYEGLLEAGVVGQVTAGSFAGQFGGTIRTTVLRWLEQGWVHVVASDAHDAHKRPPACAAPLPGPGWTTSSRPG